ncbi:MAG: SDR family oxidoreductase [Actinomycetota bacterium]|jgi:NAD(P)-dependent dehydrogenase (short-subunit alcohol dehydrogenase family)|nr:SDR family oxidoreductase [Actinomycetota bacterium]
MSGGLERCNALVTGGGSGLGLACARRLRADGATVTIIGRTESRLVTAAEQLGRIKAPGEVRWRVADVTNEEAMDAAIEHADEGGGLSIVVASAGVGWLAPIVSVPVEAWRNVMEVNVTGNFLTLKHAAPRIRAAGGGAYTAISSVAGVLACGFLSPYSTAKAAVDMFVRSAADELGPWGIRVNSILPGLVPSDLAGEMATEPELRDEYLDNMPIRRLGRPEDVAAAVGFLSSPQATWITGVNLSVDGGHHLRRAPRFDGYVRRQHGQDWLPPR